MLFLSILVPFQLGICQEIPNGAAGTCQKCQDDTYCALCNQNYFPNKAGECQEKCVESGESMGACLMCDKENNRCSISRSYRSSIDKTLTHLFPNEHGNCVSECVEVPNGMPGTCEKCNPDGITCEVCNPEYVVNDADTCSYCFEQVGAYSYSKKKKCVFPCTIGEEIGQCKTCNEKDPDMCGSCSFT